MESITTRGAVYTVPSGLYGVTYDIRIENSMYQKCFDQFVYDGGAPYANVIEIGTSVSGNYSSSVCGIPPQPFYAEIQETNLQNCSINNQANNGFGIETCSPAQTFSYVLQPTQTIQFTPQPGYGYVLVTFTPASSSEYPQVTLQDGYMAVSNQVQTTVWHPVQISYS